LLLDAALDLGRVQEGVPVGPERLGDQEANLARRPLRRCPRSAGEGGSRHCWEGREADAEERCSLEELPARNLARVQFGPKHFEHCGTFPFSFETLNHRSLRDRRRGRRRGGLFRSIKRCCS
jgi:hypothetical protein